MAEKYPFNEINERYLPNNNNNLRVTIILINNINKNNKIEVKNYTNHII